ncbi:hypothetical protein SISNIDRAFT_469200 [Sistotremastrum niveocremeum HHB9708]|uniref:Uncharacterized protein n=1 Tax=Sistotremastrum niveocremeum HHB9708 TaxID=1314777 RepID=A0A164QIL8_9AGAM|nr:hypothetical protein SISNIDRAFT_469200 [Sistotremastrum niveocremeum HHB9708]
MPVDPPIMPAKSSEASIHSSESTLPVLPDTQVPLELVLASIQHVDQRAQSFARNAENAAYELEQRVIQVNDDTKHAHRQIVLAEKRLAGTMSDLEQRIQATSAQAEGIQTAQKEVRSTLTANKREVDSLSSHFSKGLDSVERTTLNILQECQFMQKSLGKVSQALKDEYSVINRIVNRMPSPVVNNNDALYGLDELRALLEGAESARELASRVTATDKVTLYEEMRATDVSMGKRVLRYPIKRQHENLRGTGAILFDGRHSTGCSRLPVKYLACVNRFRIAPDALGFGNDECKWKSMAKTSFYRSVLALLYEGCP